MPVPKNRYRYRPAFSKEEVEALATILLEAYLADMNKPPYNPQKPADSTHAFSPEMQIVHHGLVGKINTLRTKIANDALNPAYSTTKHSDPELAVLESLGAPEAEVAMLAGTETKEVYWKRCYLKYSNAPVSCTIPEIEAAEEYRYLHDLMTPIEVKVFESRSDVSNG